MNSFPEIEFKLLNTWLESKPPITIITHFNPDGDALGSSLGLKTFLEKKGLQVDCIFPSAFPSYFNWLPNISEGLVYADKDKPRFEEYFSENRIIFCLDFNHSSRVNNLSEFLSQSKAKKILIDHHEEPSDEFDISFSYPGRSSTCELIYEYIQRHDESKICIDIATCLYAGLLTDTGGFQFSSTHSSTHQMASHLIEIGVKPNEISNLCFNNFSLNRLKLFGYCIANNMKIFEDKSLAYIWIDSSTKNKFDIQDGDTEGLVNYPLRVLDIQASVLFKQDYNKIRISFRSKDDTDVSHIAKTYFNGGGHKNAAGGMSKSNLKDTLAYFENLVGKLF